MMKSLECLREMQRADEESVPAFYFVVRHPSGLETWVRDFGQAEPANTVRREMGSETLSDDGATFN